MATNLNLSVTERDTALLKATCCCFNKARDNKCVVRITHDYVHLFLKMEKKGALLFTIAFGLAKFSEQLAETLALVNRLDRSKYQFQFTSGKKSIKISVKHVDDMLPSEDFEAPKEETETTSSFMFPIPLNEEIPSVASDILNLFEMVKIKQCLTLSRNELQLSAVGDRTNLSIKILAKPYSNTNELTKFNMLNASIRGLVRKYKIIQLEEDLPKALLVNLGATKGIEESFNQTLELMDSLTKE